MSDEQTSPPPAPPVHFDHYCDYPGCEKWGAFGKERGHGITEWRCAEHQTNFNNPAYVRTTHA